MGTYSVQAWDLNTNTLLTDLSATGVTFSERVNEPGEFSFDLSLTDPKAKEKSRVVLGLDGNPFKVLVTANDNTSIRYAGIAWRCLRGAGSGLLKVSGKALPSYFVQVTPGRAFSGSFYPSDVLDAVVRDTQLQAGANIWLGRRTQVTSWPAPMTTSYTQAQHVTSAQIIADVTAAVTPGSGGTDYYTEHYFDNGVPVHTLVICSPRAGRDRNSSQAVINIDAALDWTWPTDASASGNHIIVVGSGAGAVQPSAEARAAFPVGGLGQMPLMQQVLQYSQINNPAQLQAIADGAVQMFGKPVTTPTVTLAVDNPVLPLGSFIAGDDVLITASPSDDFPKGLNEWWRIVAYTVKLADSGVSTFTVTLNRPPVY